MKNPIDTTLSIPLLSRENSRPFTRISHTRLKVFQAETTKIHSVAGLLPAASALVVTRPFRSPHHTISDAGLIGGGTLPRPGEVSLAHNGVLFLGELPEFRKNNLEMMRQPLEDGSLTISRAATSLTYPSRFMLVAAMNPCPCGYYSDPNNECRCTVAHIPISVHLPYRVLPELLLG